MTDKKDPTFIETIESLDEILKETNTEQQLIKDIADKIQEGPPSKEKESLRFYEKAYFKKYCRNLFPVGNKTHFNLEELKAKLTDNTVYVAKEKKGTKSPKPERVTKISFTPYNSEQMKAKTKIWVKDLDTNKMVLKSILETEQSK